MKRKYELDDDTMECPICNKPLSLPIHQCRNGHLACGACCEKLKGEVCPFCRSRPFAHSRCLAVEKIVESVRISCQYAPEGCTEMLKLTKKEEHEITFCKYRPIQCPVTLCDHTGPKSGILEHLRKLHSVNSDQIVELDPVSRSVKFKMSGAMRLPFVLVRAAEELQCLVHSLHHSSMFIASSQIILFQHPGFMFCCSSFGSKSMMYNLKVKARGGSSFFNMETLALDQQKLSGNALQKFDFLLVPTGHDSSSKLDFDLELRLL